MRRIEVVVDRILSALPQSEDELREKLEDFKDDILKYPPEIMHHAWEDLRDILEWHDVNDLNEDWQFPVMSAFSGTSESKLRNTFEEQ